MMFGRVKEATWSPDGKDGRRLGYVILTMPLCQAFGGMDGGGGGGREVASQAGDQRGKAGELE